MVSAERISVSVAPWPLPRPVERVVVEFKDDA